MCVLNIIICAAILVVRKHIGWIPMRWIRMIRSNVKTPRLIAGKKWDITNLKRRKWGRADDVHRCMGDLAWCVVSRQGMSCYWGKDFTVFFLPCVTVWIFKDDASLIFIYVRCLRAIHQFRAKLGPSEGSASIIWSDCRRSILLNCRRVLNAMKLALAVNCHHGKTYVDRSHDNQFVHHLFKLGSGVLLARTREDSQNTAQEGLSIALVLSAYRPNHLQVNSPLVFRYTAAAV